MNASHQGPCPIDQRAERILTAALGEFARRGYAAARETVIARRAGVSLATLKRYFPGKEELFREVIRTSLVAHLQHDAVTRPEEGPGTAVERVQAFARTFWAAMDRPESAALLRLAAGELQRFPELALFHATEVIGRSAQRLERALAEGTRRGEISIPNPRSAARVILSALLTHAHWFAYPATYASVTGPDRERAEQAVLDVLGSALRASTP
jgi:AcrR family transcriptional regulator